MRFASASSHAYAWVAVSPQVSTGSLPPCLNGVTNSTCGEDDEVDWAEQVVNRVNLIVPRAGSLSHDISTRDQHETMPHPFQLL